MPDSDIRIPAVAGRFYPLQQQKLTTTLDEIYLKEKEHINLSFSKKKILGAVIPHAGYMFSAYQAIHFFEILKNCTEKIDTFVIINPNHTGYGEKIALEGHHFWQTPYGNVEQDMDFIRELGFTISDIAHRNEHSGEVMLPLLQHFLNYEFKVVMITFSQQNAENARLIAKKIRETSHKLNRKIKLIASSDFTHFKDPETSRELDNLVLKEIENQNIEAIEKTVRHNGLSICGFGPIMCLMAYAELFGDYHTQILARGHSGEIIPSDEVVNYITILAYQD